MSVEETQIEALYDFNGETELELSIKQGERLTLIDKKVGQGWWSARNESGRIGNIPMDYVKVVENIVEPIDTLTAIEDGEDDPWARSWGGREPPPSQPVRSADSDFDDDFDDEDGLYSTTTLNDTDLNSSAMPDTGIKQYPTINEELRSGVVPLAATKPNAGLKVSHAIKAMLFDKTGIESFLLNGYKGSTSVPASEIAVVSKSKDGKLRWDKACSNTEYQITATNEASKLAGLKQFTVYQISTKSDRSTQKFSSVCRRFKQFDWLHALLNDKFRIICIAGLPDKQVTGRFDQDFIEERKLQLELWMNRIARHPVLGYCSLVSNFLSKDLQYTSNLSIKDWKKYKRDAERDPLRGSLWFACLRANETVPLAEADIKVDGFMRFLGSFDRSNFNLQNTMLKHNEFNGAMKREYQRISAGFHEMAKTFLADEGREKGSRILATTFQETSKSYAKMAEAFSEKAMSAIHKFYYSLRLYGTMNTNFSNVVSLQRELREVLSGIHHKVQNPQELNSATERAHVINAGVLAEINLLDQQRPVDYKRYLKEFLNSQKQLYQEMADRLEKVEQSITLDDQ